MRYDRTDGEQRAASFAYYAFFALFPLLVFVITIGTTLLGSQQRAEETMTGQILRYLPILPVAVTAKKHWRVMMQ